MMKEVILSVTVVPKVMVGGGEDVVRGGDCYGAPRVRSSVR